MAESAAETSTWGLYLKELSLWLSAFHWDAHHWDPPTVVGFIILICIAFLIVRYAFRLFLVMLLVLCALYFSSISPTFNQAVTGFLKPFLH
jgi:hypothetical protein